MTDWRTIQCMCKKPLGNKKRRNCGESPLGVGSFDAHKHSGQGE